MPMNMSRRQWLVHAGLAAASLPGGFSLCNSWANGAEPLLPTAIPSVNSRLSQRSDGLVLGSLIGDALGGPIEFSDSPELQRLLCHARGWADSERLNQQRLQQLASSLPLPEYQQLRPDTAPYGPWIEAAPAGTVTDDSRHKIILQRAVRAAITNGQRLSQRLLAEQIIAFRCHAARPDPPAIARLNEVGMREYRYAAHWLLGERDLNVARPLPRLWAGVNNCSGQMMFLNLAAAFAGRPEQAYRATYELNFVDAAQARDITSAMVAGLAAVLDKRLDAASSAQRYETLFSTVRNTDPYGYRDVPYAGRQLTRWLDTADRLVDKAQGSPKRLYRLLETEGQPRFWWDAHFTLLVPWCMLRLAEHNPLAAMHLTLDFGHDTDSYAQVLGAMIGAVHGAEVFPKRFRKAVQQAMQQQFGESPHRWAAELDQVGRQCWPTVTKPGHPTSLGEVSPSQPAPSQLRPVEPLPKSRSTDSPAK